ncbi:MAG: PEP-CTERM sorting domain-containing protein, partial [Gammaproteobacteria bacterium]
RYGSRRRRALVVALMLAALTTGVGFVVVSGGWLPTPETTVDVQGKPSLIARVPCVEASGGLPCVAGVPDRTLRTALATSVSGQGGVTGARSDEDQVVAADAKGPLLVNDSTTMEPGLNMIQSAPLVARTAGSVGSYPGGAGAALAGSGAGNATAGSGARGSNESIGVVSGATTSPSLSSPSSSPSSTFSPASSAGAGSSASTASSAPSSGTASGTASGTRAISRDVAPVSEAVVPPPFVEHNTTVSDLTRGRSDTGTPISILGGGTGEPMSSTPEPSSMLLIGTGIVGIGAFLKRRRAAAGTTPDA